MLVDTSVLIRTLQPHHALYALTDWAAAAGELARIKGMFEFLPETPAIYPIWESLVIQHNVSGKPAHDARLAAAMQAHGLPRF